MPTTYEKAGSEVHDLLAEVMKEFHTELSNEDVNVGVIFARNADGPAVKKGGYPCCGKISIVSLKDRVEKSYDAELIIDAHWWSDSKEARYTCCRPRQVRRQDHHTTRQLPRHPLLRSRRTHPTASQNAEPA